MGALKQQQPRLAKLSRPRLYRAVARERLFALLDARKQQPILWIGGPAGAGKTTLVASYLEARKARTLWYLVDEGDKDPATFFHYLTELAQQAGKKRVLPQYAAQDLRAFARHYFREFFRQVGENVVLVLDNCQLAASEAFHLVVRIACEELPRHTNLIALSRGVLPSELARFAAHGSLQQIEWPDLRLTPEEAQGLGRVNGATEDADLENAYRLSDGWATGLVLSLAHTRAVNEATAKLRTREALFGYFLNEMLSQASAEARRVLTHTALLPQVTLPMAQAISGSDDAGHILEELYRNQYLIDRKVEGELTYQFHDLFRDFLLDALAHDLAPPELAKLRQRAAAMLEACGQTNEAVKLFRQANDSENVVRVIKTHAPTLYYQGRWQTLLEWFVDLPEQTMEREPWLLYWQGRSLIVPDAARARVQLEQAHARFLTDQDDPGLGCVTRALADIVFLLGEPFTKFPSWLVPLEKSLERRCTNDDMPGEVEAYSVYLEMVVYRVGEGRFVGQARQCFERLLLDPQTSDAHTLTVALTLACVAWPMGDVDLTERAASALRSCVEREDLNPIERYWASHWIAIPDWSFGRWHEAIHRFAQAAGLAEKFNFSAADNTVHCALSILRHELGMSEEAARALLEVRTLCDPGRSMNWSTYNNALAHHHYCCNDLSRAIECQETAAEAALAGDCLFYLAWTRPIVATYYVQCGRLDEAVSAVETARSLTAETIYRFVDAVYSFVLAEVATRRGMRAEALGHLREGLQHARNPIKATMLYSMTRALPRLLSLAMDEEIELDTVRYLIQRWNLVPGDATRDRWPWPVKIYALGEFRVLINDQPLPSKGRPHFRVLGLLKAIVASGGSGIAAQTLSEWLWPDVDGDAAANNLKVGIHRLRKLLGHEEAVLYHDGKVALSKRVCWLDLWAFDMEPLRHENGHAGTAVELASYSMTLSLYKGHLLAHEDVPWAITPRERFRATFHRMVVTIAEEYENKSLWADAMAVTERALAVDPSAEVFYRRMMVCLKRAGRDVQAAETFRRCQRALGMKLSRETLQLYESLVI